MLLSLGLGWPGPLQGLNNLKIRPPPCLWCHESCAHGRQSLTGRAVFRQVRSRVRSLLCCISKAYQDYLISLTHWLYAWPLLGIACVCCFLLEHWFSRGFWTPGILSLSLTLRFQLPLLFLVCDVWFCCRKSPAFPFCLLAQVSHLEQQCLPQGYIYTYLLKGLHFVLIHLSFNPSNFPFR